MRSMAPASSMQPKQSLLAAGLIGIVLLCVAGYFIVHDIHQNHRIQSMQDTIRSLQASLVEEEMKNARLNARHEEPVPATRPGDERHPGPGERGRGAPAAPVDAAGSLQILKDLGSDSDPRSYSEKLQDLLSRSPTVETAAIASRFIFENARDPQGLPDYALQSIYATQTNPDLKRVIAQVLAQRGNN